MNRENEEQKPVPQTLCGALQKEANCKCLVLSVLIYGCLAAVTWCRCANVTKIVINFSTFPIKSTKHVSPCDDGYIYIPVAFMGMLYLVYLVECYHSPIRIDLLHAEGQSGVLAKLTQLRMAQPTIWWKAISYHYARRKRQIMRYRNGDNFTTTQVYYERVNSHAATSFYFYDYCGSKDISKELMLDPKIPITKITLSKGFAFSNVRSATEFEEARSRFFAEQQYRDDYMEMREYLDLGCNFSPMTLVAVLGNPWFTRSYVYWCLSALLLSWPLRIIIECNTQYVDYQITKLFGVNYDTPNNIQIHTSASQLSAPGSYMLAPSYSEALLMEPALPTSRNTATAAAEADHSGPSDLVPSYSEALLYERAAAEHQPDFPETELQQQQQRRSIGTGVCECPCHGLVENVEEFVSQESLQLAEVHSANLEATVGVAGGSSREDDEAAAGESSQRLRQTSTDQDTRSTTSYSSLARICDNCLSDGRTSAGHCNRSAASSTCELRELVIVAGTPETVTTTTARPSLERRRCIVREYSEPDLRRRNAEVLAEGALNFLRTNGRSLENIMENEEIENPLHLRPSTERAEALILDDSNQHQQQQQQQPSSSSSTTSTDRQPPRSTGAIPKRTSLPGSSRVTVNPIAEAVKRLPSSRSTYFCLRSILKQNRRRFTLVTPEELQSLTRSEGSSGSNNVARQGEAEEEDEEEEEECPCEGCRAELGRPDSLRIDKRRPLSCQSLSYRRENSRTLIFASPIQVICPTDPFGGRNVVNSEAPPNYEEALNLPVLSRLRHSLTDRDNTALGSSNNDAASSSTSSASRSARNGWKHRRTMSTDPRNLTSFSSDGARMALIRSTQTGHSETTISLPSYDGLTVPPDARSAGTSNDTTTEMVTNNVSGNIPLVGLEELVGMSTGEAATSVAGGSGTNGAKTRSRLTRSLTERRSAPESRRHDRTLRKSFTERIDTGCRIPGIKRMNINIETSL